MSECPGSNRPPAEQVILDVVPGMEPSGTCSACGKRLTLNFYRVPEHTPPSRASDSPKDGKRHG